MDCALETERGKSQRAQCPARQKNTVRLSKKFTLSLANSAACIYAKCSNDLFTRADPAALIPPEADRHSSHPVSAHYALGRIHTMFGHSTKPRRRLSGFLRLECLEERVTPSVYTPTQINSGYGFTQIAKVNGTTLTGAGQTIALVEAYYDPNAQGDLTTFDSDFGLSAPPSFQQVSQTGGSPTSISQDSGWGGETALDIEWAHAIAPGANILLVEASNQNLSNLFAAVAYAAKQPNVSVVSMSWGFSEFSGETSSTYKTDLSTPTSPAGHANVSFVASSGDTGEGASFPSISPNVLSVGGTTLTLSGNSYVSETAWNDSGGGPSSFFSKPSYQTAYTGSQRANPDVAYDANPNTGVYVYNTYDGGLEQVGGTSVGRRSGPASSPWPTRDG